MNNILGVGFAVTGGLVVGGFVVGALVVDGLSSVCITILFVYVKSSYKVTTLTIFYENSGM